MGSHSFSVRILHIIQQNGSSSYKDRKESCQAHHREILHSIDFGFPCEQTYLCGNCHHPKQTPQKQDCWIRHSFDETSATQDCEEFPSNCKRKNVRGETTTFLRLQSWILTPLKLMLRPRIC